MAEALHVLDALGMDVIFIETIGIGQDQTAVSTIARTTVVVLNPAMGDEVQLLKAGFMEIADLFIVNKADLPGADAMSIQLTELFGASESPSIFKVSSLKHQGLDEVAKFLINSRNTAARTAPSRRGGRRP